MTTDTRTDKELNHIICRWEGKHKPTLLMPNYCRDLNAVHEAEENLTDGQWPQYRDYLRTAALGPVRLVSQWCRSDIHATARQRSEALVKVIEEGKK